PRLFSRWIRRASTRLFRSPPVLLRPTGGAGRPPERDHCVQDPVRVHWFGALCRCSANPVFPCSERAAVPLLDRALLSSWLRVLAWTLPVFAERLTRVPTDGNGRPVLSRLCRPPSMARRHGLQQRRTPRALGK